MQRSICVIAGDPSGDIAGGALLGRLKASHPEISVFGLGGYRMKAAGQEQFAEGSELAALGFWEVMKRWGFFKGLLRHTVEQIEKRRPCAIVLIDYPGFNLRLAKQVKRLGIPIIYYIAPQVWAWAKGRVKQIQQLVDSLLVVLPFEVDFFAKQGVTAEYVGHYLLEDIDDGILAQQYNPDSKLITLLPGSRQQEIERMLPTMLETADLVGDAYQFAIAGVDNVERYEAILSHHPSKRSWLQIGKTRQLIADSALVISSSGTATLETALIARPLIIIYKTSPVTYYIARSLITLKHIGLANLVAGKTVAPEFIQGDATPRKLAKAAQELMSDLEDRETMISEFQKSMQDFKRPEFREPSRRVAEVVIENCR